MKRVRCPKCDRYITFDETRYEAGQSLVFLCPECGKQFGIRISGKSDSGAEPRKADCGHLVVIENVFHYRQELPLVMGDNVIGRYQKGNPINTPIETVDPSVDLTHCVLNVSRDKRGELKYTLRDGPSNTGTFVDNELLGDRERRVITDGTLFTLGATSLILHAHSK
jgi:predicted RNA-binding Zn-ribbon protein involved in translation (DUF1610 family)